MQLILYFQKKWMNVNLEQNIFLIILIHWYPSRPFSILHEARWNYPSQDIYDLLQGTPVYVPSEETLHANIQ